MSIHIQQLNSDGTYSYYYPDYANNSDKLDGLHKESFLTKDSICSTNNLNVWINQLDTYSFSLGRSPLSSGTASLFYQSNLYGGKLIQYGMFLINSQWTLGGYVQIEAKWRASSITSKTQWSVLGRKFFLSSSSDYNVGETIFCSSDTNPVDSRPSKAVFNTTQYYTVQNYSSDRYRITYSDVAYPFYIKSEIISSEYSVDSQAVSTESWINSSQKYSKSKNLLQSI